MRQPLYCAVCLFVALGWAGNVLGAPVAVGGFSIEATQTLDTVNLTTGTFGSGIPTELFVAGSGFGAAGLTPNHAIGRLMGIGSLNDGIALGDNNDASTIRGLVRMSLYGALIKDIAGPDLYVSEEGSIGGCEGLMLRVSTDNGTTFTPWQYRQEQVLYNPTIYCDFFTGFDLVNDFGLTAGATVTHVEMQNINLSDKVNGATGEGQVVFAGDPGYDSAYTLLAGPLNTRGNVAYKYDRCDADPGYIFYGASIAVLQGDANRSLMVDVADLTLLLNNYNKSGQLWDDGDFNRDGQVDVADLTSLLNNYNQTSSGLSAAGDSLGTVPEPSSIAMLGAFLALLSAWAIRRRG